jgi:pimeloyl-ACP methyl ester carboxylesterase
MTSQHEYDPAYVAALPMRRTPGGAALYTAGNGPPALLFVHGGYHGAWCYGAWMRALAEQGVASAAVDLPGHGSLSHEGLDTAAGMDSQATSLVGALEALDSRPILVGHSLGGMIVALAATRTPVGPLVLAAPSPPGNLPGAKTVPAVPAGDPAAPPSQDSATERFLGGEAVPWIADFHRHLCPESPALLNDRYGLRVTVDPARMPRPSLVLEAGRDCPIRHPAGQDAAIARFYGSDYRMLPAAGHCLMVGPWAPAALAAILDWGLRPDGRGAQQSA